ncbi:hypothetical protein AH156_19715 [Salmonella enterica subsp. enterica serovar Enteritidis]|nr:hypothetical protein [Salmonella enterica subsp. enterica serovar Enteritidis]
MFQLKNFVSIAASMLNYVRSTTGKVTDLQPGSVTRTIIEAPAAEIEELYVQVFNGIKEAIPVAVYNSINFPKLTPHYANGIVTVIRTQPLAQDLLVPKGTNFLARDGRIYQTVADQTWPAKDGQGNPILSYPFPVISQLSGLSQNAAAGEINASPFFNPTDHTFSSTDMVNGSDEESDAARDIRFADYIKSLSRGTEAALLYGASTAALYDAAGNITESVTRVSLTVSTGTVRVNIWGSNGAPSAALVARTQEIELGYRDSAGNIIPGYAAAGIRCQVASMGQRPIDVNYTLEMFSGYALSNTIIQSVKDALSSYLYGVQAGDIVYIDDIQNAALLVRGVKAATVDITQNFTAGQDEVLVAGVVGVKAKPVNRIITITFSAKMPTGVSITLDMIQKVTADVTKAIQALNPGDTITLDTLANFAKLHTGSTDVTSDQIIDITRGLNEVLQMGAINVVSK